MELSARKQLKGTVTDLKTDGLMTEITVDVSGQTMVSVITRSSAERLQLGVGDTVTVMIKSTEIMLAK